MTIFLYTLRLEKQRYYVGTTNDPRRRLAEHRKGQGAEWTMHYAPIGFSKEYPLQKLIGSEENARLKEDAHVKRVMLEHGIDLVRGGSYSSPNLARCDVHALCKELFHAKNGCLRCGRQSHWANDCYAKTDIMGNAIENDINKVSMKSAPHKKRRIMCVRCGRTNHTEHTCYATTTLRGDLIIDTETGSSDDGETDSSGGGDTDNEDQN